MNMEKNDDEVPSERPVSPSTPAPGISEPLVVPGDVPAFPCIIHLTSDGGVYRGRVANLAGIEAVGNSERELLGKIVPLFKQAVAEFHQRGESIPWVKPVPEPENGECKRFIPVHL